MTDKPEVQALIERLRAAATDWPDTSVTKGSLMEEAAAALESLRTLREEVESLKREGWVSVPVEPNHNMMLAGLEKLRMQHECLDYAVRRIWKAMLAAAKPEEG